MLDRRGTIVTWNAAAEHLTGYCERDILHDHFSRLFPRQAIAEGRPQVALQHAAACGATHEGKACLIRPDGTPFTVKLAVKALREKDKHNVVGQTSAPTEPPDELHGFLVKLTQVDASDLPPEVATTSPTV